MGTLGREKAIVASARTLTAVTKSDSTVLNFQALWIGGAGNVAIKTSEAADAVTIVGVPAGTILPISGGLVMSTNTTATNIVALDW
jgi:hypothetical protein